MADKFTDGTFNSRPLVERLDLLRREYCTGPCGQSNSVMARREALNRALKESREIIECVQRQANSDLEHKKVD